MGGMKTDMIMNAWQTAQNQCIANDGIQSIENVFNTVGGGENLLAAALAANNVGNINSHLQATGQQEDFQQLPTRLISAEPANPKSYIGSALVDSQEPHHHQPQSQYGAQHAGQDQPHQRQEIPLLFPQDQSRQNPFAMFDTMQANINLSGGGPPGIDNKPFQDNLVSVQSIANAAGDLPPLSSLQSNSPGGIHLLQQQLAALQQQLLQQQPNSISDATQLLDHQQLLPPHGNPIDQSLQLDQQKQFTQLQQSLQDNVGLTQMWMQGSNSGQNSAHGRTFNPPTVSFNGPTLAEGLQGLNQFPSHDTVSSQANTAQHGSIQGNNMMSGLQQFQQLLQMQMNKSDHRSFIGSVAGEPSKDDEGMQASLSDISKDRPKKDPTDAEPRTLTVNSKKTAEVVYKKKKTKTFPEKLMQAMMEYGNEEAISWLPDGKSFVIVNPDFFCDEILKQVFKESKYASFVRKLHRWGFVRLTSGTGTDCFHHPLFQKNRSELVTKIVCTPRGNKDDKIKCGPNSLNKPPSLAGVEKFIRAKVVAAAKSAAAMSDDNGR